MLVAISSLKRHKGGRESVHAEHSLKRAPKKHSLDTCFYFVAAVAAASLLIERCILAAFIFCRPFFFNQISFHFLFCFSTVITSSGIISGFHWLWLLIGFSFLFWSVSFVATENLHRLEIAVHWIYEQNSKFKLWIEAFWGNLMTSIYSIIFTSEWTE